jgi:predicted metal-dependent hydrolase
MRQTKTTKSSGGGKSKTPRKIRAVKRALLKIDGRSVEIVLRTNPRARRFIVKVDPATGEVSVVAPNYRSLDAALAFARKEKDWIALHLANVPAPVPLALGSTVLYRGVEHVVRAAGPNSVGAPRRGPAWIDRDAPRATLRVSGHVEHAPRRIADWLKQEARVRIDERATEYARMLGVKPRRITLRDTSTRWGSCSSTRNLSFSWRLILAPPHVLDYVVAHEIAHLREMNHEPRFWRLVENMVPDMAKSQAWLAEHGTMLHRYAPRIREID